MDSVFDDGSKTWATVTNKLYAQTAPCLILQDVVNPGKVSSASDGNAMRPTEVLVEVIWGVPLHGVTPSGDEISGAPRHRRDVVAVTTHWLISARRAAGSGGARRSRPAGRAW